MKKLLKNKKALSPVVAAIILIAVTVAVSIAVAAWMGNMTFQFMATEEMKITGGIYDSDHFSVTVINTGTTDVNVVNVKATGGGTTVTATVDVDVTAGGSQTVNATISATAGSAYQVELITAKGNAFPYTIIA